MSKSFTLSFLFLSFAIAACTASDPSTSSSAQRAIIQQACAADGDCPAGFACEIEVEHGTTSSFCQAEEPRDDGSANGGCPAGYELEIEHGQAYCQPHTGGGSDDTGAGSGSGSSSGCTSNADCATGLECELETGTCKAHGGH